MSGIPPTGPFPRPLTSQSVSPALRLPKAPASQAAKVEFDGGHAAGGRPSDSVHFRAGVADAASGVAALEKSIHNAQNSLDQLDRVGGLLDELRGLVRHASGARGGVQLTEIQSRVDLIIGTIDEASAQSLGSAGVGPFSGSRSTSHLLFRNESITTNASGTATAASGSEAFSVDVVVTTSAQQGGFLLSFGAGNLELGGFGGGEGGPFTFEIEGIRGTRTLSFISGTTISNIATAINSFAKVTGVSATLGPEGTNFFLRSDEYGADAFTSVRVIASGDINAAYTGAGIYQLKADNTNEVAPGDGPHVQFAAAEDAVVDHGQDVQATIGGIPATSRGLNIRAVSDHWSLNIDLSSVFAAGLRREPTPVAWFAPNPAVDVLHSGSDASPRDAQAFISDAASFAAQRRSVASAQLAELKEQLRTALGGPLELDEKQKHLDALAAIRQSLLSQ